MLFVGQTEKERNAYGEFAERDWVCINLREKEKAYLRKERGESVCVCQEERESKETEK